MDGKKRKIYPEVIAKYQKKAYDMISIRIPKEMAAQFKEKCAERGVSQAQVVKEAIKAFLEK